MVQIIARVLVQALMILEAQLPSEFLLASVLEVYVITPRFLDQDTLFKAVPENA